jgi:hypothetical protein
VEIGGVLGLLAPAVGKQSPIPTFGSLAARHQLFSNGRARPARVDPFGLLSWHVRSSQEHHIPSVRLDARRARGMNSKSAEEIVRLR